MKLNLVIFVLFVAATALTQAQESQMSIFTKNQKIETDGTEIYASNLEMKSYKKFGAGLVTGGLTGGIGLNLEINLQPKDALFIGLGRGNAYNTVSFGWKQNFVAEYLSFYTKVGYASWFNNSAGENAANDNDILKRTLSSSEMQENKFNLQFFAGGAGLEYNQLEGELSGVNFFGEVLLMAEMRKSTYIPTGSVGVTYFY